GAAVPAGVADDIVQAAAAGAAGGEKPTEAAAIGQRLRGRRGDDAGEVMEDRRADVRPGTVGDRAHSRPSNKFRPSTSARIFRSTTLRCSIQKPQSGCTY